MEIIQQCISFPGHPNYASRLRLTTTQDDVSYSAQVSDYNGRILSTVNNTTLQTMELIIPAGKKQYLVNIATEREAWLDNIKLTIDPNPKSNQSTSVSHMNIAYSQSTASTKTCEVWISKENSIYLYDQPKINAQALLILPVNVVMGTDARTVDGWYRLRIDGNVGWANGSQISLNGNCANLPVDTMFLPTSTSDATSTAPYDVDRHYFAINTNRGGTFANKISYPNGDSADMIQATLSDYQADRTVGVVMKCNGSGIEALQWGQLQNATLGCNDTLVLGFTQQIHDIQLVVMLPAVSGQQYVEYQLDAMPIAPSDDDQHVVPVDRNQGGVIQQVISYPVGDTQDVLAIYAHNLQATSPDNYREIILVMHCNGNQIETLRWGSENTSLRCGDSLSLSLSHTEAVRHITVNIPPHAGQSFIDYTLYAIPSAPIDNAFWFGVDRDDGGAFNESLSSPMGDLSDSIDIITSNLTQNAPNHFREMTVTLFCEGFNKGNIRWGLPGNPSLECGQTVSSVFIHSSNQQTIEILLIDPKIQSYVNYTVVVEPQFEQSILKNETS